MYCELQADSVIQAAGDVRGSGRGGGVARGLYLLVLFPFSPWRLRRGAPRGRILGEGIDRVW